MAYDNDNQCSSPSDSLAQLVECQYRDPKVPGSNPEWPDVFLTVVKGIIFTHYNFDVFFLELISTAPIKHYLRQSERATLCYQMYFLIKENIL